MGVRHVLGVVFLVVSVAFVHWDAKRTKMHHPNFWIVTVAFFPPMLVLYLIRRYQHLSQTKLSKRQVRELIKRRKSRARMKKADADRKAWSKAEKGYKKRDPDGFKETKERVEEEKEALREQFEDELERQEKLRKHRMGVRH